MHFEVFAGRRRKPHWRSISSPVVFDGYSDYSHYSARRFAVESIDRFRFEHRPCSNNSQSELGVHSSCFHSKQVNDRLGRYPEWNQRGCRVLRRWNRPRRRMARHSVQVRDRHSNRQRLEREYRIVWRLRSVVDGWKRWSFLNREKATTIFRAIFCYWRSLTAFSR